MAHVNSITRAITADLSQGPDLLNIITDASRKAGASLSTERLRYTRTKSLSLEGMPELVEELNKQDQYVSATALKEHMLNMS
jgi:hypothetical protein